MQRAIASIWCWGISVLLISFFLLPKCTSVFLKDGLQLVIFRSLLALLLPIAYCILDAAGTFADDLVLETLNEDSANVAYELTFLAAGIVSFIYTVVIKKQKLLPKAEGPKYVGAAFETAGQLAYIYALASGESALAAPIIASYCMVSVLWSRLFLKEKLSWKHYTCILVTFAGILIMGIYDM